jgi:bifunctional DNA-binding transcriptional regulator/antitoxin component of YhaV-PrlF toxin-antitoxin module
MQNFEEIRTVTADGRLIMPWVVQVALGLEHGGPVRFRVEGDVVTVHAAAPKPATSTREVRPIGLAALMSELKILTDASARDGAARTSGQ